MASANFGVILALVMEHLNISANAYGTFNQKSAARYPYDFVIDEIIGADVTLARVLAKANDNPLQQNLWKTSVMIPDGGNIPLNHNIIACTVLNGSNVRVDAHHAPHTVLREYKAAGLPASPTGIYYWAEYNGKLIYTGTSAMLTYIYIERGIKSGNPTSNIVFNMPPSSENAIAYLAAARIAMKAGDAPELVASLQTAATAEAQDLLGAEIDPND